MSLLDVSFECPTFLAKPLDMTGCHIQDILKRCCRDIAEILKRYSRHIQDIFKRKSRDIDEMHLSDILKRMSDLLKGCEVGGWGRDPKKFTGRDWGMGLSTI